VRSVRVLLMSKEGNCLPNLGAIRIKQEILHQMCLEKELGKFQDRKTKVVTWTSCLRKKREKILLIC
jgi:hypothetical protein